MKKSRILFTPSAAAFILKAFGLTTDKDGYILDKNKEFILSETKEKITINSFSGMMKRGDKTIYLAKHGKGN